MRSKKSQKSSYFGWEEVEDGSDGGDTEDEEPDTLKSEPVFCSFVLCVVLTKPTRQ